MDKHLPLQSMVGHYNEVPLSTNNHLVVVFAPQLYGVRLYSLNFAELWSVLNRPCVAPFMNRSCPVQLKWSAKCFHSVHASSLMVVVHGVNVLYFPHFGIASANKPTLVRL